MLDGMVAPIRRGDRVVSLLDRIRNEQNRPKNAAGNGRKKDISGHGTGVWQTRATLAAYREDRNAARKRAKASRKAHRS